MDEICEMQMSASRLLGEVRGWEMRMRDVSIKSWLIGTHTDMHTSITSLFRSSSMVLSS